jgi:uncharacterized ParB-like nuclease family protein
MKIIQEIENCYLPLVKRFLPERVNQASEIGYQIELFLSSSDDYFNAKALRLKEEGNTLSETLYDLAKIEKGTGEPVDDLYLPVEGNPIYFGFNLQP